MKDYECAGQGNVVVDIVDRKCRWIGHTARKGPGHLTRRHFNSKAVVREGVGGYIATHEFRKETAKNFNNVEKNAQDRTHWRRLVNAL